MNTVNSIKIYLSAFLVAVLTLSSCSMEPELTSNYDENVLWSSDKNMELYLNSFYPLIGQSYYNENIEDDAVSDIFKKGSPYANENLFAFGSVTITPVNNIFDKWGWAYTWISECNRFLDGIKNNGGNLSSEARIRGEAEVRFFRGYLYFSLARRYGASVILHKELQDMNQKDFARCTPAECWDFISEDLTFAANNLPVTAAKGKLTKGGALGLKARAMLYAERWKDASDAAQELFDLNMYDLYPDYGELFKQRRLEGKENKESIIEFGFSAPQFGYPFDIYYCPPGDGGRAFGGPTENLVSQYQMADGTDFDWNNPAHAANPYAGREKRFYASILYNGASWKGRVIQSFEGGIDGWALGGETTPTGYYIRKFLDESQPLKTFENGDLTYYFMRYAEVLLIYAEAMAEQGNLEEALAKLNEVRRRAGFIKSVHANDYDSFMELLRRERMVELAFEGHRFWDLRRWGLAKSVLNDVGLDGVKPIKNANGTFTYELIDCDGGKKRVYLDKYARFPIPQSEIQKNSLCEQFEEWK